MSLGQKDLTQKGKHYDKIHNVLRNNVLISETRNANFNLIEHFNSFTILYSYAFALMNVVVTPVKN